MKLKTFWYRFGFLAVLLFAPYLLVWVLPGTFYPASYFRALELIKLGEHHQDVKEEIEGVKLFQSTFPELCSSHVHLGNLYVSNNQNDLAVDEYHQAWKTGCLSEKGILNLIIAEQHNPDALQKDLETWIAQHPETNVKVYLALIDIYEADEQYQQAADLAEQWIERMPEQVLAWETIYSYGLYYPIDTMRAYARNMPQLADNLTIEAQRIMDAYIISTGESDDIAYYRLGTAHSNNGEWALAEECFKRSIAIEPDRTESWINLAISQKNQGKDSTNAIQEAGKRAGHSDTVRSLMGIYWRDTEPEIAYVYWMKLIASQPEVPEWLIEGGSSLAQMGDLDGAEALLQKAIDLSPDRMDVLAAYVQFCLLYDRDLSTTGLELTRAMIQVEPQNPLGYIMEGQVLSAAGDYITAERMYLTALELDQDSAAANYFLGLLYRTMNESENAWKYLQRASQSDEEYYQRAAARLLDSN